MTSLASPSSVPTRRLPTSPPRPRAVCPPAALRGAGWAEAADRSLVVVPEEVAGLPVDVIGRWIAPGAGTSSVTAALRSGADGREIDTVVVGLEGVDRFRDAAAPHRLVERLLRLTEVRVLAAVLPGDRDALALAARLGVHGLIGPGGEVGPVLVPAPQPDADQAIADWFERTHHADWHPWMEQAAAALASGADRGTQGEVCRQVWSKKGPAAAQHRLRLLRTALARETNEHPGLEQRLALTVLRAIAPLRPIAAVHVAPVRSLQLAATVVRRSPNLLDGLPFDGSALDDLLEIEAAERDIALRVSRPRGRPGAAAWRLRRDQAIGRVAGRRAHTAAEKRTLIEHLTTELDDTLLLIHDTLDDVARDQA